MTDQPQVQKKQAPTEVPKPRNPLLDSIPISITSFEEWKKRWNNTEYLAERLGLLHYLTLENNKMHGEELISFLLELADGYTRESNFQVANEGRSFYTGYEKERRIIALKAFGVLCLRFFRTEPDHVPNWLWMIEKEALFQKVLWFLQSESRHRLRNFSRNVGGVNEHQQEVFLSFLRGFARLGWTNQYSCYNQRLDDKVMARLVASRPKFIEILDYLGELGWLNREELDKPSIQKLTKIAMETDLDLPPRKVNDHGYRQPECLNEAVLGGSVAAEVIILNQIRTEEKKRLEALLKESQREENKKRRQRELADLKKQKEALNRKAAELSKRPH